MGKNKEEEEKKTTKKTGRLWKKAGLHLPAERVGKRIRKDVGKRRVQKNTHILMCAHTEYLISMLLKRAADEVSKSKYIESSHLNTALHDTSSPVYGVFPMQIGGIN